MSLARFWGGLEGRALVPAPPAPVGHAFAPWLGFRGGKAVAATSGVWSALTLWEGPVTLGACLAGLRLVQAVDAWSVLLGMLGLLVLL